jgi:hypothetical protein
MCAAAVTPTCFREEPLETALRPVHEAWLEEAQHLLLPALEENADFWTRWAAVRYLSDEFQERYRLERAFADELRPLIRPASAQRLDQEGDRVRQLRLELDRMGRRRGTAAEFAGATRRLLEQLGLWCAEEELAARRITRDTLSQEGARLLRRLEANLQLR